MKNQNKPHKAKQKRSKRTVYDRSQIDVAVDLVMRNKLSLRAASHIYKIPFSTLRTRKIFLEEHPDEELSVFPNSSSFNSSQQSSPIKQQSSSSTSLQQQSQSNEERIQEMREKPLTLHNVKSANITNNAKTEALIASLAMQSNNTQAAIDLKNRLTNAAKQNKTYLKKPLKKRLKDLQPQSRKHKAFLHKKGGIKFMHFKENTTSAASATAAAKYLNQQQRKKSQQQQQHHHQQVQNHHHHQSQSSHQQHQIKKISKATLKNNELILSSINARRQHEESTIHSTDANEYQVKECRYFKCKDCKLIFIDPKHLREHQLQTCKQIKLVHEDKAEKLQNLSAYIDKQEKFKCSFCKTTYLNKFSFLSHAMLCNVVNSLI